MNNKKLLIEVGAYDGSDSLNYHRQGYEVYTFEPKKDLYANLVANTKHLTNYTVIPKAVCLNNGTTTFNICKFGGASSILPFRDENELKETWVGRTDVHYSGESYEVETTRLDTFIEENGLQDRQIDYIHIDAQGVDFDVLKSVGKYIKNVVGGVVETVIDEKKSIYIGQNDNTLSNIQKFLEENNFKIKSIISNDSTQCEYNVHFEKKNIMQIAICITGRLNDDIEQYNNLIYMITNNKETKYEIDFFVSYAKKSEQQVIDNFIKLYQPKDMMQNDEEYFDISKYTKGNYTIPHNTLCMYLNKKNVSNMLKKYIETHNIKYNIIISTRIDLCYNSVINYDMLKTPIDNNILCIPSPEYDHGDIIGNTRWFGINDQIAYGNYDTMIKYLETYDSLYDMLENGIILHPETLLFNYLKKIKMELFRFPFSYYIKRF